MLGHTDKSSGQVACELTQWPVPRRKDGILQPQLPPTDTALLTSWGNAANLRIR